MILVFVGPDTYQAREKAREFERLYKEKHDPSGVSVERVAESLGPRELAAKLQGGGLFAKKTCLRLTGVLGGWKTADWKQATELFATPNDDGIALLLEEELDTAKEAIIRAWPKAQVYRHEHRTGSVFLAWAKQRALQDGCAWDATIERFARESDGDAWTFTQALPQWRAAHTLPALMHEAGSPFAMMESYMRSGRVPSELRESDEDLSSLLVQQARQALRAMDGVADARLPPFVRARWERVSEQEKRAVYQAWWRSTTLLAGLRSGQALPAEWTTLL